MQRNNGTVDFTEREYARQATAPGAFIRIPSSGDYPYPEYNEPGTEGQVQPNHRGRLFFAALWWDNLLLTFWRLDVA